MKKPINTDNSLKAWRRITISLAAITVVLTVIFSYFLYDSLRNAGTDESKASAADTYTSAEEAKVPDTDDAVNIPEEALYYGGNYYWVYEYGTAVTWEEAEEFCEKQGGHLAVITSDELNDMLFAYVQSRGYKTAFFGYSDIKIDGNWQWVTKAQPSYTNWGKNEPNAAAKGEDYAMFSTQENNGTWNDSQFGFEASDFICQWGDEGIHDEVIEVKIPEDAFYYNGNAYYLFDNGITSWHAAQQYCKSLGGDLAVIYSKEENEQLFNYMVSKGYDQAFIGLSDRESIGIWKWVSGKRSDFTDWGIDEDGYQTPYESPEIAYYGRFNAALTDGHWDNSEFGDGTYAYIGMWENAQ